MTLDDIFNQLSYGELVQIYAGSGDAGLMDAGERTRIAASINMGLLELHKRFLIREAEEVIPLVEGTLTYNLSATDAIRIERIYDSAGNELGLNTVDDINAIRTPTLTSLKLSSNHELDTDSLTVVYRAKHPKLDLSQVAVAPEEIEVDLPDAYLEALLFYVASRVLNPIGIADNFHDGNNYAAKFEMACQLLSTENIRVDTLGENTRLEKNGWV